jgi:glycerophosphoryl diester phosphodiesterase
MLPKILLISGLSILGGAALLFCIYLLLIRTKKAHDKIAAYRGVNLAHRGLHGEGAAENSMTAFRRAKEAGFGVELDVRLSKDGELVVFHDDDLTRVVGKEGKVKDFTAEELSKMSLLGTSDGIPTFREVLDLIDGSVPLLVELKVLIGESGVTEKFVEVIEGYKGDYIVESFNPVALRTLRKLRPDVLRGILSMEYSKEERYKGKLLYSLAEKLMLNFIMRPDFIAYDHRGHSLKNLRLLRRSFGTPLIAWTVRTPEEGEKAISHGFDTVIFEGYIPEN